MGPEVLFVSPRVADAGRLAELLSPLDISLDHVPNLRSAERSLRCGNYRAILTEEVLADGEWTQVLALVREIAPGMEVLVTARLADARLWAEVLNLGAFDLVPQPFYAAEVRRIFENVCREETHVMHMGS